MALSYQASAESLCAFGCASCKALAIGYERPQVLSLESRFANGRSAIDKQCLASDKTALFR